MSSQQSTAGDCQPAIFSTIRLPLCKQLHRSRMALYMPSNIVQSCHYHSRTGVVKGSTACRHILFQVSAGLKALPPPGPAPPQEASHHASDSASTATQLAKVCLTSCHPVMPSSCVAHAYHTVSCFLAVSVQHAGLAALSLLCSLLILAVLCCQLCSLPISAVLCRQYDSILAANPVQSREASGCHTLLLSWSVSNRRSSRPPVHARKGGCGL